VTVAYPRVFTGHSRFGAPPVIEVVCLSTPSPERFMAVYRLVCQFAGAGEPPDMARSLPPAERFAAMLVQLLAAVDHRLVLLGLQSTGSSDGTIAAFSCEEPQTVVRGAALLASYCDAVAPDVDEPSDADGCGDAARAFVDFAAARVLDPNTRLLLAAAQQRDLPTRFLDQEPFEEAAPTAPLRFGLLQVGHGSRSRVLLGSMPKVDDLDGLAVIADRALWVTRLRDAGLPVPVQDAELTHKMTTGRVLRAAARLGGTVTLRPRFRQAFAYRSKSQQPASPLGTPDALESAARELFLRGQRVWVERYSPGTRHHFLVIGGDVCAIAADDTGPRLRQVLSLAALSPAIVALAQRAAACCALTELAGVEIAIQDLQGSAESPNCCVLDVLPDPDLRQYAVDDAGAIALAASLLQHLLPPPATGRIPLVAVTGSNGKTTCCRMIAHVLRTHGRQVGLATTAGAYIGDDLLMEGDVAGVPGAAVVLADPRTEVAVLETARGGLIHLGAGFDRCDVGVCLNVGDDHVGSDGVATREQLANVKAEVIRRTAGVAVLNADDPLVLGMATQTAAREVILVSRRGVEFWREAGLAQPERAMVTDLFNGEQWLLLREGGAWQPFLAVREVPACLGGAVSFNVDNLLSAAAACWALAVPLADIAERLRSFLPSIDCNPGRFNLLEHLPFRVVLDYAHNADGMQRLCEALRGLPEPRRRLLLLRAPGSRSEEQTRAFALAAAQAQFDVYVCSERGEESAGVPVLLAAALLAAGVAPERVLLEPDADKGLELLLAIAQPEDLLVLISGRRTDRFRQRLNVLAIEPGSAATLRPATLH